MTIATMDEFTAITEPGMVVQINNRGALTEWTRNAQGWERDGVTVLPRNFVGAVAAGSVARLDSLPPKARDFYAEGRYGWLILTDPVDGMVWAARVYRHEWNELQQLSVNYFANSARRRATEVPAYCTVLYGAAHGVLAYRQDSERSALATQTAQRELATAQHVVSELRAQSVLATPAPVGRIADEDGLIEALHRFARDEDEDLDEILEAHDIGRVKSHEVTVTITGASLVRVAAEHVRENLNGDFDIDDIAEARVDWTRVVNITKTGTGCLCDEVDRSDLVDYLPEYTDDWDFETECG